MEKLISPLPHVQGKGKRTKGGHLVSPLDTSFTVVLPRNVFRGYEFSSNVLYEGADGVPQEYTETILRQLKLMGVERLRKLLALETNKTNARDYK